MPGSITVSMSYRAFVPYTRFTPILHEFYTVFTIHND